MVEETLVAELAQLYAEPEHARRLAEQVDLPTVFLDFAGPPITVWRRTVSEARRRNRLPDLVAAAAREYPENRTLAELAGYFRYAPLDTERVVPIDEAPLADGAQMRSLIRKLEDMSALLDRRLTVLEAEVKHVRELLGLQWTKDDTFDSRQWVLVTVGIVCAVLLFLAVVWMAMNQ